LIGPVLSGSTYGHSLMMSTARLMRTIASKHNIAFIFTNYTVSAGRDGRNPGLGESWSYVPNTQLFFHQSQSPDQPRSITLNKSSRKPFLSRIDFDITEEGIINTSRSTK